MSWQLCHFHLQGSCSFWSPFQAVSCHLVAFPFPSNAHWHFLLVLIAFRWCSSVWDHFPAEFHGITWHHNRLWNWNFNLCLCSALHSFNFSWAVVETCFEGLLVFEPIGVTFSVSKFFRALSMLFQFFLLLQQNYFFKAFLAWGCIPTNFTLLYPFNITRLYFSFHIKY